MHPSDEALRLALAAWLRWHAPSAREREGAPATCSPLLDEMSRASGAQNVARLASEIEKAGGQAVALAACSESRRLILEMACSELGLCADAFEACSHADEVLRARPCGCGSAAKSVRAVIARWREQVKP